ncbi:MAG: hypothetical protein MZW92_54320 [Comamonadaceae bacterium]|nr:hypothetical protein [Comamonadaceae bacterium]
MKVAEDIRRLGFRPLVRAPADRKPRLPGHRVPGADPAAGGHRKPRLPEALAAVLRGGDRRRGRRRHADVHRLAPLHHAAAAGRTVRRPAPSARSARPGARSTSSAPKRADDRRAGRGPAARTGMRAGASCAGGIRGAAQSDPSAVHRSQRRLVSAAQSQPQSAIRDPLPSPTA